MGRVPRIPASRVSYHGGDGVDGYVVETDNVDQTAEKLNLLLNDKERTKVMGETAAKYAKNFSVEKEAKRIIEHVKDVQNK